MEADSNSNQITFSYDQWNDILADYLLSNSTVGGRFYLTISPSVLAAAYKRSCDVQISIDQAISSFADAVINTYRQRVIRNNSSLSVFRSKKPAEAPSSVAFLAFSVLAAHAMHADQFNAANAYYPRLAELLKCSLVNGCPKGLDSGTFKQLWLDLANWLMRERRVHLAMPPKEDEGKPHSIVAIPRLHALLRQADLIKLPREFWKAGFSPGDRISDHQFDRLMSRINLTPAGQQTLLERRIAVLAQVTQELAAWDGSFSDEVTAQPSRYRHEDDLASLAAYARNNSPIHLYLDFNRSDEPRLFYAPQRLGNFPPNFASEQIELTASDESWYDFVQVQPEDGAKLRTGFTWRDRIQKLSLCWRGASSVVFAKSSMDASGFNSQRGLPLNDPWGCHVLCHESILQEVGQYLNTVTQANNKPSADELPNGWFLFKNIIVRQLEPNITAPDGLEIVDKPNIRLTGGLRLGRRQSWLKGALPIVSVYGSRTEMTSIMVDNQTIAADEEGKFNISLILASAGSYTIHAGDSTEHIEIVEPSLEAVSEVGETKWDLPPNLDNDIIALPLGDWWLLGSQPDQVLFHKQADTHKLINNSFAVIWAIKFDPQTEVATIICLKEKPSIPVNLPNKGLLEPNQLTRMKQWSWAILTSTSHQSKHFSLSQCWNSSDIRAVWRQYLTAANKVKKAVRNAVGKGRL